MDAAEYNRQSQRIDAARALREDAEDLARRRNLLQAGGKPLLRIDRCGDKLDAILDENDPPKLHEAIARAVVAALRDAEAKLHAEFEAL